MSHQVVICLIAVAVNLAGMIAIYAATSHAFAQLAWGRRGSSLLIGLIVVAQLFWIVPALWIVEAQGATRVGSYALWFGNWIVGGFAIVLFSKSAERIPSALGEAARIDGLGSLAIWRHTVFPFVGRDLVIVGMITIMATLLPFWIVINQPEVANSMTIFARPSGFTEHLTRMVAASLLGAVPLLGIFVLAKPRSS